MEKILERDLYFFKKEKMDVIIARFIWQHILDIILVILIVHSFYVRWNISKWRKAWISLLASFFFIMNFQDPYLQRPEWWASLLSFLLGGVTIYFLFSKNKPWTHTDG